MLHETSTWSEVQETVDSNGYAVVYFSATWCQPCKQTKPQYAGASVIDFGTPYFLVDIDELDNKDVLSTFGVQSIPRIIFLRKEWYRDIESRTKLAIVSEVSQILDET